MPPDSRPADGRPVATGRPDGEGDRRRLGRRVAAVLFGVAVAVFFGAGTVVRALDVSPLPAPPRPAVSVVYDRHGVALAQIEPAAAAADRRASVGLSLEEMAPAFVDAATVVTKARRGTAPAPEILGRLWAAVRPAAGDGLAGAASASDGARPATLAAELADATAAVVGEPSTGDRLRAALLTTRLERDLSASVLLERYLNAAPYGRGTFGADAGAQAWFGVPAAELDVGQAAFLASRLAADGTASAAEGRNAVLFAMYQAAAITADELQDARAVPVEQLVVAEPAGVRVRLLVADAGLGPAMAAVRAELARTYGNGALERGGLHVLTTIDLASQRVAVEEAARGEAVQVVVLDDTAGVRAAVGEAFSPARRTGELFAGGGAVLDEAARAEAGGTARTAGRRSVVGVAAAFSVAANDGELRGPRLVLGVGTEPPSRGPVGLLPTRSLVVERDAAVRLAAGLATQVAVLPARVVGRAAEVPDGSSWFVGWSDRLLTVVRVGRSATGEEAGPGAVFAEVMTRLHYWPAN
ncbi:MAG TPA: hypothetical protein DEP69_01725 [Acidimicrobiaceae bacterium]|nr:hypothetical protein [Acidimicrobiaceae bacterium]